MPGILYTCYISNIEYQNIHSSCCNHCLLSNQTEGLQKITKKTNPYNLNSKTVKLLPNRSEGGIYWGLFYMGDPQPPCSLVLLSLLILLMPSGHQINNALPSSTLLFYVFLCFTPLWSALICSALYFSSTFSSVLLCATSSKSVPVEAERQRRAGLLNNTIALSCSLSFCNNQTTLALEQWQRLEPTSDKTHLQPPLFLFVQNM